MAQIFKLYRLQQLDNQIDKIEKRLTSIAGILKDNKNIVQAEANLELVQEKHSSALKQLRHAEDAVRSQKIKIEYNQTNLYAGRIQNPKELQDLQHESVALSKLLAQLEESQLDIMIKVEEIEAEVRKAQDFLAAVQKEFTDHSGHLMEEQAQLSRDRDSSLVERNAVASTIPPDELSIYESLRPKRGGIAVARVQNKSCTACGTTLSATLLHDARNPTSLTYCDTCSRILYAD